MTREEALCCAPATIAVYVLGQGWFHAPAVSRNEDDVERVTTVQFIQPVDGVTKAVASFLGPDLSVTGGVKVRSKGELVTLTVRWA